VQPPAPARQRQHPSLTPYMSSVLAHARKRRARNGRAANGALGFRAASVGTPEKRTPDYVVGRQSSPHAQTDSGATEAPPQQSMLKELCSAIVGDDLAVGAQLPH
jgi:hypothetical protein